MARSLTDKQVEVLRRLARFKRPVTAAELSEKVGRDAGAQLEVLESRALVVAVPQEDEGASAGWQIAAGRGRRAAKLGSSWQDDDHVVKFVRGKVIDA